MVLLSPYERVELAWLATNGRMPVAGSRNEQLNRCANSISTSKDRVASSA